MQQFVQASKRLVLAAGNLSFLDFIKSFAIHTEICSGTSFESADADINTTLVAKAVVVFFHAQQSLIDLLDKLALADHGFAIPD